MDRQTLKSKPTRWKLMAAIGKWFQSSELKEYIRRSDDIVDIPHCHLEVMFSIERPSSQLLAEKHVWFAV